MVESIEARGRVVGEFGFSERRIVGKRAPQRGHACLTIILDREAEEWLLFEIKNKLGRAFGYIRSLPTWSTSRLRAICC